MPGLFRMGKMVWRIIPGRGKPLAGRLLLALILSLGLSREAVSDFTPSGKLEIHYINVGQGGCTLIIGPDGTRLLYDFGAVPGRRDIVPYLRETLKLNPPQGLHYTFVSHRDKDHYLGYRDVVEAGYDVQIANFAPDSPKPSSRLMNTNWLRPAAQTTAGTVRQPPVGMRIPLGGGAEAVIVAVNGQVLGEKRRPRSKTKTIARSRSSCITATSSIFWTAISAPGRRNAPPTTPPNSTFRRVWRGRSWRKVSSRNRTAWTCCTSPTTGARAAPRLLTIT